MDLLQFVIRPINNVKMGNEILKEFQKSNPNFFDFQISITPDAAYGYWMTISYKVKEKDI